MNSVGSFPLNTVVQANTPRNTSAAAARSYSAPSATNNPHQTHTHSYAFAHILSLTQFYSHTKIQTHARVRASNEIGSDEGQWPVCAPEQARALTVPWGVVALRSTAVSAVLSGVVRPAFLTKRRHVTGERTLPRR